MAMNTNNLLGTALLGTTLVLAAGCGASGPAASAQPQTPSSHGNGETTMNKTPLQVMSAILANPKDLANVKSLVTEDVGYVSLNYDNPELKKILPWTGTGPGAERIVKTFTDVGRFWKIEDFKIEAQFESGENVAIFGRFTYRSVTLGKAVTSPFAVFAKVRDGRCYYMQFMEDTLATASSFRAGGTWTFRSDPNGGEVTIP